MNALFSLLLVLGLAGVAWVGVTFAPGHVLFGIVIPYAAIVLFLGGFVYRIVKWAKAPVPFKIPTTCGQEKSLDWIKHDRFDCPQTKLQVVGRMALEILFFRSLFRNTKADVSHEKDSKLVYGPEKWLWGAALIFHWSFLIIFVRHFKFFAEPVPLPIIWLSELDGFFQIGLPVLYITDLAIVAGLTYLFFRRVWDPKIRYISLATDYFPLFLLLGIAISGILMRYFIKVDVVAVKELGVGLLSFSPQIPDPQTVYWPFYVHLLLVSALIAYFPFSKLMHLGGVFLSPTRNLPNNNRAVRHINPWNPKVKTHSYQEWQEEYKDKIEAAGLPLDKE